MIRKMTLLLLLTTITSISSGQTTIKSSIDSLFHIPNDTTPFSGTVLVFKESEFLYDVTHHNGEVETQDNQQYVIGSISKQFTAAIILQLYDKGKLQLHTPIRQYLPGLKMSWADSVTIHHLLTHTHGIIELEQPLAFPAGTQFQYSQIGYALLANIIENVTGKSFAQASAKLFRSCEMKYTFHPALQQHKQLVKGYEKNQKGQLVETNKSFENYVAAGGFISTAKDLVRWNILLHNGHVLSRSSYELMIKPYATRQHPIFGPTQYGYGITVGNYNGALQLGQTGYAPGFVSMNFYFPEFHACVIVLENIDWDSENIKNAFYYHTQILSIVRAQLRIE